MQNEKGGKAAGPYVVPVSPQAVRVLVMGVSGCGKSTVGAALAAEMGSRFCDGDSLHSAESVQKMTRGEPLTDDDRWPLSAAT